MFIKAKFAVIIIGIGLLFSAPDRLSAQTDRPAFPTDVSAVPVSACSLKFNWNQNEPGAFSHTYFWSTDNFNTSNNRVDIPAPNQNYAGTPPGITGQFSVPVIKLTPGAKYYYKVQSCSPSGCSDLKPANNGYPAEMPRLPDAPIQSEITKITVTPRSNGLQDIKLTWKEVGSLSDYGGYLIYMSTNNGPYEYITSRPVAALSSSGEIDFKLGSSALVHSENSLPMNKDYSFFIKTYESEFGCLSSSNDPGAEGARVKKSEGSSPVFLPARPRIISGDSVGQDARGIRLSFEDYSAHETRFELVRNIEGVTSEFLLPENTAEFTDSNVLPNKAYTYKLRSCYQDISCSAYSETMTVTLGIERPVLKHWTIYSERNENGNGGESIVQFSWLPVAGASRYNLLRRILPDGEFTLVHSTAGSGFKETIPFGNYEYLLEAIKGSDKSTAIPVAVSAGPAVIFKGYGWSAMKDSNQSSPVGLGWISFNSLSRAHPYSVQADTQGLLSGLAWTRYGWLSFNKDDLKGCPVAPCEGKISSDGSFRGWARFLARNEDPSSGAWSGWLKLSGVAKNNKPYGLKYINDASNPLYMKVEGAAWGGNVVGYVALGGVACLHCNVSGDRPPEDEGRGDRPEIRDLAVLVTPQEDAWCSENPAYTITWNYSGSFEQEEAVISFIDLSNGSVVFTDKVTFDKSYRLDKPLERLRAGSQYRVSVTASDGYSVSEPAFSSSFTTPTHLYPLVHFSLDPKLPKLNEPVTFADQSIDRSRGVYPINSWRWLFDFASIDESVERNPEAYFFSFPASATLTITDTSGASCSGIYELTGSDASTGGFKRRQIFER